jgi:hypothetical protein
LLLLSLTLAGQFMDFARDFVFLSYKNELRDRLRR